MRISTIITCFLASWLLLQTACTQSNSEAKTSTQPVDSNESKIQEPEPEPELTITYQAVAVKRNDSAYKALIETLTGDSLNIFLQLNRIDKQYIRRSDTVIMPTIFTGNIMDYSPFPAALPLLEEVDKLIIFSYPVQAFAVYERGQLIRWGASSMGKESSKTPTGLHYTNWKGRKVTSSVNRSWILEYNFNIMNKFGVGWHQYELPGYPASHACLRLFMHDAKWLYEYCDSWILKQDKLMAKGNPVLVYGEYPWDGRKPWLQLIADPKSNDISEKELNELLEPLMEEILREQENRKQFIKTPETPAAQDVSVNSTS